MKGKADAFKETLDRLVDLMSAPTPPIPSEEIQEELENLILITKSISETAYSYDKNSTTYRERKTTIPKLESISTQILPESSNRTINKKNSQPLNIKKTQAISPQHIEGIINLLEDISRTKHETLLNDTVEKTDDTTNIEPENSVPSDKETIEKVPFMSLEKEEVNDTTEDKSTDEQIIKHKQQKKITPLKVIMIAIAAVIIISALVTILVKLLR